MIYFKEENGKIIKYEVTVNEIELKRIRDKIIKECSHRTKEESLAAQTFGGMLGIKRKISNNQSIEDYNSKFHHTRDGRDGPDVDIYIETYILLKHPKIVGLIDALIGGNATVIDLIFNYSDNEFLKHDFEAQKASVKEQLDNLLTGKLGDDPANLSVFKTQLNFLQEELIRIATEEQLNANIIPVSTYMPQVLENISFEKISELDYEEYKRVSEFFGIKYLENANTLTR